MKKLPKITEGSPVVETVEQPPVQRLQQTTTDRDRQGALFVECMTDNQRQLQMFGGE